MMGLGAYGYLLTGAMIIAIVGLILTGFLKKTH